MRVFNFDGATHRQTYRDQGWLHVQGGLTDDFLTYAGSVVEASGALDPLDGAAIKGAKAQHVFDFPDGFDYEAELFTMVAGLTGWDPGTVTLSERHIKAYLPDAESMPVAHKDRFASAIAVGLTLRVGENSHIVMYPKTDRTVNPHLTAGLNATLLEHDHPAVALESAPEVCIQDQPGDVMAFPGSSLWHLRRNSASTVLLYLKFNNFGCDPLAEDPSSVALRERTQEALAAENSLLASTPILGRGFDSVGHETGRAVGRATWHINVWQHGERRAVPVPEAYASIMQGGLSGSVAQLAKDGVGRLEGGELVSAVRRLAEIGALDLLTPVHASTVTER